MNNLRHLFDFAALVLLAFAGATRAVAYLVGVRTPKPNALPLLNADDRAYNYEMRIEHEELRFAMAHPRLAYALAVVRYAYLSLICRLVGHDLEDFGFGTPDCGCIDLQCRRCGWSAGTTWLY